MTEEKLDSIYFLKTMLNSFRDASDHFRDYLTSNSKDSWDRYNINSLGWIGYAQIMDHNLMPDSFEKEFDNLILFAKTQYNYSDFTPEGHNPEDAIRVLEILAKMKSETQKYLEIEEEHLNENITLEDKSLKEAA